MVSAPDRGGDYSSFDRGRSVWIRLRPHESRWLSSEDFEKGTPGLGGRLGALTQGHHLFIRSRKPLWAMNLMLNPTGRFFNIYTAQVSSLEENGVGWDLCSKIRVGPRSFKSGSHLSKFFCGGQFRGNDSALCVTATLSVKNIPAFVRLSVTEGDGNRYVGAGISTIRQLVVPVSPSSQE